MQIHYMIENIKFYLGERRHAKTQTCSLNILKTMKAQNLGLVSQKGARLSTIFLV
mgnify:CR=1 FL=1